MTDFSPTMDYIVNHVFLPPKLPQQDDSDDANEHALCLIIYQAAQDYTRVLSAEQQTRWAPILKMLERIDVSHESSLLSKDIISEYVANMECGGMMISISLISTLT